jgi:hypothetical protein
LLESGETGREVQGLAWGRSRELVEERGEKVRVVDDNGQLGEDVLVAKTALLQAVGYISVWQLRVAVFRYILTSQW